MTGYSLDYMLYAWPQQEHFLTVFPTVRVLFNTFISGFCYFLDYWMPSITSHLMYIYRKYSKYQLICPGVVSGANFRYIETTPVDMVSFSYARELGCSLVELGYTGTCTL